MTGIVPQVVEFPRVVLQIVQLAELESGLPEGVEVVTVYDRSALIERAVDNLLEKLLEEVLIVALVCVVFLFHFRSALVAIVTLPLGILISFIVMYHQGLNANIMSLGGIAIAIVKESPAIILDEPTAGLDPTAGLEFIRLLEELRDEGKAILMATHDIFRAKEVADVVGIMKAGKLVMQRTRGELTGEDLGELYVRYMAG